MPDGQLQGILEWLWQFSPVVLGGAGGFLFYRFVGCKHGVCPITKNPWLSTLFGAILGAMLMSR